MELWKSAVTLDRVERRIVHTWEVDATPGRLSLWPVQSPKSCPRLHLSDTYIPTHVRRTALEVRWGVDEHHHSTNGLARGEKDRGK